MNKKLVFVGGGHAHLSSLLSVGDYMKGGHLVTLISLSGYQYYSGMGPGAFRNLRTVANAIQCQKNDRGPGRQFYRRLRQRD